MTHNKYAILNEEYHLNYKEEEELKKALQESKKMFDKKNKKEKEINDNQLLVATLNSKLSNKREQDRHIDATIIDSEKMYKSEQDMCASKQMGRRS